MAYTITSSGMLGSQAIADTSTTQNHPLGTVVTAYDPTYGGGEFIYLLGVGSTIVGSLVTYNATTYQTALGGSTANLAQPVAVAMSANVASAYGWYQIEGNAVAKKAAVAVNPQVAIFLAASGRVTSTVSAGKQILGARSANLVTVASGTSTVVLSINRPHAQGQTT